MLTHILTFVDQAVAYEQISFDNPPGRNVNNTIDSNGKLLRQTVAVAAFRCPTDTAGVNFSGVSTVQNYAGSKGASNAGSPAGGNPGGTPACVDKWLSRRRGSTGGSGVSGPFHRNGRSCSMKDVTDGLSNTVPPEGSSNLNVPLVD